MTPTPQPPLSTPGAPTGPRRSRINRTSLITAAAITGVLIAGTAAVAANIGILNAADSNRIGDLAATDQLLPTPAPQVVDVADTSITTSPVAPSMVEAAPTSGEIHQFDIDAAGSVWVRTTQDGVTLDHVDAVVGWSHALSQVGPRALQVEFTNGDRTIVFTASLTPDGHVTVDVTEPTPSSVASSGVSTGSSDHHDDADHHDDHPDDHHDDHHAGADDDD